MTPMTKRLGKNGSVDIEIAVQKPKEAAPRFERYAISKIAY